MKRRLFLSLICGTLVSGAHASPRSHPRRRKSPVKKLVVLFQRGGNDGLNTMIPIESTQYGLYQALRPDLHVPQASISVIPSESFFGLHPALDPLIPIIDAGELSLIHAVGYPDPDRSHFESQAYLETSVPGNGLLDGWLNRYLANTAGPGLIRGISIGSNIPQSVTGAVAVPVSRNFGQLNLDVDNRLAQPQADTYRNTIAAIHQLPPTPSNDTIYDTGNKIFQMITSFADRDLDQYVPEHGAAYPTLPGSSNPTDLALKIMHAAQMLKDDVTALDIEVVTIDHGSYDTHSSQVDPSDPLNLTRGQPALLNDLAGCMAAFHTDMGPARMADILFLVVTEFGRRAYQNDSWGTDHGTGSLAMVMGPGVTGAMFNGGEDWPGLETVHLYQGHDLMWMTDFRDIYWEILERHMNVASGALSLIIPGHTPTPVGFLT